MALLLIPSSGKSRFTLVKTIFPPLRTKLGEARILLFQDIPTNQTLP